MSSGDNLGGQLLIAMPALQDPNFHQTVTYLCEHSEHGAFGVVINRPLDMRLSELLAQVQLETSAEVTDVALGDGGPVQSEGCLILHRPVGEWAHTLQTSGDMAVTGSLDVLEAIAAGQGPADYLIVLGHAGWGPGQLESEMLDNAWLTVQADPRVVFEVPVEERWRAALDLVGVDPATLSAQAGHA